MTGRQSISALSVAAAALLSVVAFLAGNAYSAALSSMGGQWVFNLQPALLAAPGHLAAQGISPEKGDVLAGFVCFTAVWLGWSQLILNRKGNRRTGQEHGSARWATPEEASRFKDRDDPCNNIVLTEDYWLVVDPKARRRRRGGDEERPRNILVIGGTGAGKSWRYCIPNILQMNSDYFVIDTKGQQLPLVGHSLLKHGYDITCLNLVRMAASAGFNPFDYIHDEAQIIEFAECLIANTTGDEAHAGDPFWTQSERLFYVMAIGYLKFYCPKEDQNFAGLLMLLSLAQAKEDDEDYVSPLDLLFREVETGMRLVEGAGSGEAEGSPRAFGRRGRSSFGWVRIGEPTSPDDDFVIWHYHAFKAAAGKTVKSILISCNTRLAPFAIPQVKALTAKDEMALERLGDGQGKHAVFVISKDTSQTFSFILAIALWQTINSLCDRADALPEGSLPGPVHFICDEFANVGKLPDIEHVISVVRSRNVYLSIILQSFSQLKEAYGEDAETIVDNCDTLLYLGGKSGGTQEMISKMIGKETVEVPTVSVSRGPGGTTTTTNYALIERDLIQPSEINVMGRDQALLLISNAFPIRDGKYPTREHPRYRELAGKGPEFPEPFDYAPYLAGRRAASGIRERTFGPDPDAKRRASPGGGLQPALGSGPSVPTPARRK